MLLLVVIGCLCVEAVCLVTPTITGNHNDRWLRGLRPRRPYGLRIKNSDQTSYTTRGDVSTTLAVTHLELPRLLAKVVGVGLAFLFNFWINAVVVFRAEAE